MLLKGVVACTALLCLLHFQNADARHVHGRRHHGSLLQSRSSNVANNLRRVRHDLGDILSLLESMLLSEIGPLTTVRVSLRFFLGLVKMSSLTDDNRPFLPLASSQYLRLRPEHYPQQRKFPCLYLCLYGIHPRICTRIHIRTQPENSSADLMEQSQLPLPQPLRRQSQCILGGCRGNRPPRDRWFLSPLRLASLSRHCRQRVNRL